MNVMRCAPFLTPTDGLDSDRHRGTSRGTKLSKAHLTRAQPGRSRVFAYRPRSSKGPATAGLFTSRSGTPGHDQLARPLEAARRLVPGELALDLAPRLLALGLAQPREHLVQRAERLTREADVLGG
jgi:hypothetical protein